MKNILGFALYGPLAASTRYRLLQYVDGLRRYGINLEVHSLLSDKYVRSRFRRDPLPWVDMLGFAMRRVNSLITQRRYDAAIVYCELFRLLPGGIESSLLHIPYLYDFDDAFHLRYDRRRSNRLAAAFGGRFSRAMASGGGRSVEGGHVWVLGEKFDQIVEGAGCVTAGSRSLYDYATRINSRTKLLPTVVDTARYVPQPRSSSETLTIGWIGSPSTSAYLEFVARPLNVLASEGRVRVVVMGGKAPAIPNAEVVETEWSEALEVEVINTFDIGIMPSPDDEWSRGKCAFKLIQYMACGVPVVASKVGANIDVVQGACGFLAETDEDWLNALRWLRDHPGQRADMGYFARQRIEDHYSLKSNLPLLADSLQSVLARS